MAGDLDALKGHHHCVVVDEDGTRLLSRRVHNDEETVLGLLEEVVALADGRDPALEAAFDYAGNKPALLLLTRYRTLTRSDASE